MAESHDDPVLDAKTAAGFVGVAAATLAKLRCMGGGPIFIKAGRKIL
jgi:hypothetical protein